MNTWFECKVIYEKGGVDSAPVKVTESYLIDALNYTSAENRVMETVLPFSSMGEVSISSIKRVKLAELFLTGVETDDKFYKSKVSLISFDEKAGKEKRTAVQMLIQSNSLPNALDKLVKEMDSTLYNYEILSIADTPIVEVLQQM